MFWKQQQYETPLPCAPFQEQFQRFADKNGFALTGSEQQQTFTLTTPSMPRLKYLFSIQVAFSNSGNNRIYNIRLNPNVWVLAAMLLFIGTGVWMLASGSDFSVLAYSIPFAVILPYMYTLYAHKILTELKDVLIPDYSDTSEGRKESLSGYLSPLKIFMNIQAILYIGFVVVFLTGVVLYMLGKEEIIFSVFKFFSNEK